MPSTKETFFREHLLPLGQMVTLMHAIPKACDLPAASRYRQTRQAVDAQALLDALSLVSCAVIHPKTREFTQVSTAVRNVSDQMVSLFESLGVQREPVITRVLGGTRKLTTVARTVCSQMLTRYLELLPTFVEGLHTALDYTPAERTAWLALYTQEETPLTKGGRINRWRSLALSTSWDICMAKLRTSKALPPFEKVNVNVFTSPVSVKSAEALWKETFSEEQGHAAANSELLPPGVSVQSTKQGMLHVSAVFLPASAFSIQHQRMLDADPALAKKLKTRLAQQVFSQEVSLKQLESAVVTAEQWLLDQEKASESLAQLLMETERAQRVEKLKSKLIDTFSKQELELLVEVVHSGIK